MPLLLAFLILTLPVSPSLGADRFVYGNLFFTGGSGTTGRESQELAGYGTFSLRDLHLVTVACSDLAIRHDKWDYRQQSFTAGGAVSFPPFGMKGYFSHLDGNFDLNVIEWGYSDRANLGNLEFLHLHWPWYVGAGATYFSGSGYLDQEVTTWTARVERPLFRGSYLSLRPSYTLVGDGRRLYSASARLSYQPHPDWVFRAGGHAGERAYYFDNDLLTLFNQPDTQRGMAYGQADYRLWRQVWLSGEYLYSRFRGYDIRYAILGLKSRFPL